jgi:hypothetical protein
MLRTRNGNAALPHNATNHAVAGRDFATSKRDDGNSRANFCYTGNEPVLDKLPLWARLLAVFGWSVAQEFQVMSRDDDGVTAIEWTTGLPTRKDADERCDKAAGQWTRRVLVVWDR